MRGDKAEEVVLVGVGQNYWYLVGSIEDVYESSGWSVFQLAHAKPLPEGGWERVVGDTFALNVDLLEYARNSELSIRPCLDPSPPPRERWWHRSYWS